MKQRPNSDYNLAYPNFSHEANLILLRLQSKLLFSRFHHARPPRLRMRVDRHLLYLPQDHGIFFYKLSWLPCPRCPLLYLLGP